MADAIDLLYPTPARRVSHPVLERALVFAFSSGDTARAFERVLENSGCGASSFAPECFCHDLFVDDFIERCLPIRINGTAYASCKPYLKRILSQPPSDVSDTRFRQQVLAELDGNPAFRGQFEQLYVQLQAMRNLLATGDYSTRIDQNLRRLDILSHLARVFRSMAAGFEAATSGLQRIRSAGAAAVETDAFRRLEELLEYERHLATVDVRLQLGMGGSVRNFQVLGFRQNTESQFYEGWWSRFWSRLTMLLSGTRVTQHEVLTRLMDQTFEGIKAHVPALFQLLGDMEVYLGALGFADMGRSAGFAPCLPDLISRGSGNLQLNGLYNPFLLAEGIDVRPCDLDVESDAIVVLTGPNSGGKTRLLQSVALTQMLAQAGLMVPAAAARVVWTGGMFVSLLDEVKADQREGRLGTELLRIRRLFEQINCGDLVVLDELCSGTNPSEGEEIFRLVVGLLGELKPQVWLTTHFLQFAERLRQSNDLPQLHFLQVRLDEHEHPTFEFEPGVAKTSLARQTAARLGVTWEELGMLVEQAKARSQRPGRTLPPPMPLSEPHAPKSEPLSAG